MNELNWKDLSIEKIWFYPCPLINQSTHKKKEGLVFKIQFSFGVGYSSFYPMPSLGDLDISTQMERLKKKNLTYLTKCSILMAQADAQSRSQKTSLCIGTSSIESHYLVLDVMSFHNFNSIEQEVIKVKMTQNWSKESSHLRKIISNTNKKIRLDFNYNLNEDEWNLWQNQNQSLLNYIDFIEDPYLGFKSHSSLFPLALDFGSSHNVKIRIIKPSRYSLSCLLKDVELSKWDRIIFTNSLDHPMEAKWASFVAHEFYKIHPSKKEVCGLYYDLHLFKENPFSYEDSSQTNTGLGYNSVLENLNWIQVM